MPAHTSADAARASAQSVIDHIFRLHSALLRHGDRMGRDQQVTASHWQVLSVLQRGPQPVAAIARQLELKRQSVQRTVDLLVGSGLVRMRDNPQHRRSRLALLTPRGAKVLQALRRRAGPFVDRCNEGVDPADLAATARVLTAWLERMNAIGAARPSRRGAGRH